MLPQVHSSDVIAVLKLYLQLSPIPSPGTFNKGQGSSIMGETGTLEAVLRDAVRIPSEPLKTRRVVASERPRSRDLLIILRSFFSHFFSRVLITASCSSTKRPSSLQNTRPSTRSNHTPFRPHCPLSFILPFFSSSRLTLSNKHLLTQRRHHEAAVRSFSSHFSFHFMHSFIHHHRHPRGRRYYTN